MVRLFVNSFDFLINFNDFIWFLGGFRIFSREFLILFTQIQYFSTECTNIYGEQKSRFGLVTRGIMEALIVYRQMNIVRNPVQVMRLASEGRSMAFALRSGGYPESTARHPKRFMDNKYFLKSLYDYLEEHPEEIESVVFCIKAGLHATQKGSTPDHNRRLFFLHLVYKIKGYL